MADGMDMWMHSTGLAQPVDNFAKGVELRAMLQKIDMQAQAAVFDQTMAAIKTANQVKQGNAELQLRQQEIDLRARESENRMRLQQEGLDLRRSAMANRGYGGSSSSTQAISASTDTSSTEAAMVPNIAATPLPPEMPSGMTEAKNYMAAAPAGETPQISPFDLTGAGQPEGMPMQAIPSVDQAINQNPMMEAPPEEGRMFGTIDKPIRRGNTEFALINGVQSSRTISKTGSQSKFTPLPGVRASAAEPAQDPTEGAYTNDQGVLVKKIGDSEIPVETITQRSKAGSVTMRQPKKVEASRVSMNADGTGIYTDENGDQIQVQAKGMTYSNGKWSVRYEVPGADPIEASPDEKAKQQLDSFEKLGIKLKSASFNSKGQIQLQGSIPAESKPEAGTIGAMTAKWDSKAKAWRDELIDAISNPTPEQKASAVLDKPTADIKPGDMKSLTTEQWTDGYRKARLGAARLLASRIEKLEGVDPDKTIKMLFGTLREDITPESADLPPIELHPSAVSPVAAPKPLSRGEATLQRILGK
jgi:hypothetical protein